MNSTTTRRPIILVRALAGIEILAILAYWLTAKLGNFEYDWYPQTFLHAFISFQTAKFLFLSGAQFFITLYVFVRWYRKSQPVRDGETDLTELLKKEENAELEFKASLRFDYNINRPSRNLERSAMKTIAAFLNSKGGNVIVGVNDQREPVGLSKDYGTLQRKDRDGFENHFTQVFNAAIGPEFRSLVHLKFEQMNGAEICRVSVKPSPRPVYFTYDQNEHFYMRTGNITTSLKLREVESYVRSRWPKI